MLKKKIPANSCNVEKSHFNIVKKQNIKDTGEVQPAANIILFKTCL